MKISRVLTVFDTHSSGITSRIVLSGFPDISGETMLEKTKHCQENLDHLRKAIILRPSGFARLVPKVGRYIYPASTWHGLMCWRELLKGPWRNGV